MYLYLSPIGEWTKPPRGTTKAQLLKAYRQVRLVDDLTRKLILAQWVDGKRTTW